MIGATGHSQGIVTAVAVAASSDWTSFLSQSRNAVTTLFRIGLRSQMVLPSNHSASLDPRRRLIQ